MKFVTFNIRCDHNQDGNNSFCYRKPLILKTIAEKQPDILCFQEVLPHVAEWLRENLTSFVTLGCGRSETLEGEQMTVAYRPDKYNLMEMHTFWMSEMPYVPGSRYEEQSTCPRTCTEVLLFEKETKQVVRVLNLHLDHEGAGARKLGLKQVLNHIDSAKLFPEAATIITGDFNDTPDSIIFDAFHQHPGFVDASKGIGRTFHDYGRYQPDAQIDYIWVRGDLECQRVEKWTVEENGLYLSDHYPVMAELVWKA